jgi:hypothetical protein
MRAKIKKKILDGTIFNLIENNLIEIFDKIKENPNPDEKDLKYLIYHAIAYFQYLNLLGVNQAVELYKEYILSDGKKNMLTEKFYYLDGDRKMKANEISLPLYFDNLLKEISQYLMNHKNIIETITKNGYKNYIRDKYRVNASDITLSHIIELLEDIKVYSLIALKKHWITINKEILPYLLEKTQVTESKE